MFLPRSVLTKTDPLIPLRTEVPAKHNGPAWTFGLAPYFLNPVQLILLPPGFDGHRKRQGAHV